jgi:Zn-dependent protease with chaperone function
VACWAPLVAGNANAKPANTKAKQKPDRKTAHLLAAKKITGMGWQDSRKSMCNLNCLRVSYPQGRISMPFTRRWLVLLSFPILLAAVAPRLGPAPRACAQTVPAHVASQPAEIPSASAPAKQEQAYSLPPDKLAKAIAISRIRNILDIVGSLWGLAVLWLLLATHAAAGLGAWAERVVPRRWLQGLLFFAVFLVVIALASLPLDLVGHVVSRNYGISVQGWRGWIGDQAKALGLTLLFGAPILLLFNWIVRRWPRRYWFGAWLATLPILVLATFVSPLLEPIFNKYEPLENNHPALVSELEKVVARTETNIPPDRMFLMNASVKTDGLNAYVSGLGATKRIVVWDTTAGRIPDDEILFIFGHESGHYVLNHIPKMIAGMAIALFFVYWSCAGFAAWMARRFGPRWRLDGTAPLSTRAGFVVLLFAVSIASFVLTPAGNAFSRHFEHQADVFGQEAVHSIVADPQKTAVAAFNHLGEAWLEDPNPSPFIEFWEYNHPSVQTRANFAAHYNPWAQGGKPKFFKN